MSFLVSFTGICIVGTLAFPAFAGLGDDFGTRDPIVCAMRDAPRTGAPSVLQATRYVACNVERIGDYGENIYLVANVRLKVSPKGRPYDVATDAIAGIDTDQPVYDIHGGFRLYRCGRKTSAAWQGDPGHACRYHDFHDMTGWCWKGRNTDWQCTLPYKFDIHDTVHDAAPPP